MNIFKHINIYHVIILALLIAGALLLYTFFLNEISYQQQVDIKEPFYTAEGQTHALMPPNIPFDCKTSYVTGGKHVQHMNMNIGPQKGKYVFPIPQLKYDGIYKSVKRSDGDIVNQEWFVTDDKNDNVNGYYSSHKLFHLPKYDTFLRGIMVKDPTIFYGDRNIIKTEGRNDYSDRDGY